MGKILGIIGAILRTVGVVVLKVLCCIWLEIFKLMNEYTVSNRFIVLE